MSKDESGGCALASLTGTLDMRWSSCDVTVCGVDDVSSSLDCVPVGVDMSVMLHVSLTGSDESGDVDSASRGKTVADGDMV